MSRPLSSYAKVQSAITFLVSPLLRGQRLQFTGTRRTKRYLNAGCGPNLRSGFLNLDYDWRPGIDLCWDLRKALPIPDAYLDGVYTEHCLEHLDPEEAQFALGEFKRVLRPGGTVRVVVPDAELFIDLYQRHKSGESVQFPFVSDPPPEGFTSLLPINRVFCSHGHRFAYDAATMSSTLSKAGFSNPRRASYLKGADETLLIDSESRVLESLYMEATA